MKLVFKGLGGESRNEDTTYKIRQFLSNDFTPWRIRESTQIWSLCAGRYRPIVARFLFQEDLDLVLDRANWLNGAIFSIQRQYPTAMEERRRELIPIMRQLRMEGATTKLVREKL